MESIRYMEPVYKLPMRKQDKLPIVKMTKGRQLVEQFMAAPLNIVIISETNLDKIGFHSTHRAFKSLAAVKAHNKTRFNSFWCYITYNDDLCLSKIDPDDLTWKIKS